jgi:signal transduction histidine kinase
MTQRLKLILLTALLYYVGGEISFALLLGHSIVNIGVFIPEGIALAFALYYGRVVLAGIFIGQFFLAYFKGVTLESALIIAFANMLEAYLAIYLKKYLRLDIGLNHFRDIFILMAMILFLLQPLSALMGNMALYIFDTSPKVQFLSNLFSWWFGNVMGQMLITPALLLFLQEFKKIDLKEFLLYGVLFFSITYFLELVLVITNPFLLLSLTLPWVIYAIFKKGLVYGLFFNVIIALVSSYTVYLGIGAFQAHTVINNVINYNLFVLVHITIALTVGILNKQKKAYEEHLEEMVAREVEKNRQQQLLMMHQSRLAQMGEMISMIAHQWRQPLNNLSMINQLLVNKYKNKRLDDAAVDYFYTHSKQQIEYMSATIDDFRNFFQKERPKENFFPTKTIEKLLELTAPEYNKEGIKVILDVRYNHSVYGYENEFAQAFLNLLNNAKDALRERKVSPKTIWICFRITDEKKLEISVEDNAGGINAAILEKIFEPYFSTKKSKNGTGLGLYMSKMIFEEQMHASLEVSNTKKGARFRVLFDADEVF